MKISLPSSVLPRVEKLEDTRRRNFRFAELMSRYLNLFPDFVKEEYVSELLLSVSFEEAFCAALTVALGLDTENEDDRVMIRKYLPASVKCLDSFYYRLNPYYQSISFPDVKCNDWEIKTMSLAPWEGFVYNDPVLLPDFTEIPRIGFFREKFSFPAVLQNGREWMTLMPNETATLENAVKNAFGNVVTYGLGLGYFAYRAAAKDNVQSVTVVEKDENVIKLFTEHILPLFPCKDKITVLRDDAFSHAEKVLPSGRFDYVLADIWHDAGDGTPLYLRFRDIASKQKNIKWDYWLEETIVSYLRWPVFSEVYKAIKTGGQSELFPDIEIKTYQDIQNILSCGFLHKHACEIGEFFNIQEEN